MRQKTTEDDTLTAQQQTALAALLAGKSITEAASDARVARQTLSGWLHDDFTFRAALNRERRELMETHSARLHALVAHALDAVEAAVKSGDVRASLAVLRGVGAMTGTPAAIGSDDPEVLATEQAEAEAAQARFARAVQMQTRFAP